MAGFEPWAHLDITFALESDEPCNIHLGVSMDNNVHTLTRELFLPLRVGCMLTTPTKQEDKHNDYYYLETKLAPTLGVKTHDLIH